MVEKAISKGQLRVSVDPAAATGTLRQLAREFEGCGTQAPLAVLAEMIPGVAVKAEVIPAKPTTK